MASPVDFPGTNTNLVAPPGREGDVRTLPVFRNGHCVVSCWLLSAEERDEVERTGLIWLSVLSGETSPPVFLGTEAAVKSVVADYGAVWSKKKGPGRAPPGRL